MTRGRQPVDSPRRPREVREACRRVVHTGSAVSIVSSRVERVADHLASEPARAPVLHPGHHLLGRGRQTWRFIVVLDAVNFGSGSFDRFEPVDGREGYEAIAWAVRRWFERSGTPTDAVLSSMTPARAAEVFGQSLSDRVVADWLALAARGMRQVGRWLTAGGWVPDVSAVELVERLQQMPMFRDEWWYPAPPDAEAPEGLRSVEPFRVPILKRAQLLVSDMVTASFERWVPDDLAQLTVFADNMVPAALRALDILKVCRPLRARIQNGELLQPGEPAEIELRAASVVAAERLLEAVSQAVGADGGAWDARVLDGWLWRYGRRCGVTPHLCRTPAY